MIQACCTGKDQATTLLITGSSGLDAAIGVVDSPTAVSTFPNPPAGGTKRRGLVLGLEEVEIIPPSHHHHLGSESMHQSQVGCWSPPGAPFWSRKGALQHNLHYVL